MQAEYSPFFPFFVGVSWSCRYPGWKPFTTDPCNTTFRKRGKTTTKYAVFITRSRCFLLFRDDH